MVTERLFSYIVTWVVPETEFYQPNQIWLSKQADKRKKQKLKGSKVKAAVLRINNISHWYVINNQSMQQWVPNGGLGPLWRVAWWTRGVDRWVMEEERKKRVELHMNILIFSVSCVCEIKAAETRIWDTRRWNWILPSNLDCKGK